MTETTATRLAAATTEEPSRRDPSRDDKFVDHLLHLRTSSAARSALRRGDQKVLASRAVPYLASWFTRDHELTAALLFAAALSQHDGIHHQPGTPAGSAIFHAIEPRPRDASDTNAGRRVIAMQRQALPVAHRTLTGMLAGLDGTGRGLDWRALWNSYRLWDIPQPEIQRRVRRRILLDFYGVAPHLTD